MKSGTIFGTSTEKALSSWIENCRIKEISRKSLNSRMGNSFLDKNSSEYLSSRDKITDIVQQNRAISIEVLYSKLPNELLVNPSTRIIIFDMCNDGDIHLQSKTNPNNGIEGDFVLVFQKRKPKMPKKEVVRKYNGEFVQSNIEDVMDNQFYAKGRKLEFDYKERNEPINIDLKKPVKSSNLPPVNKNVKNVRSLLENINVDKKPIPQNITISKEPVIESFSNIKSINVFESKKNTAIEKPVVENVTPIRKIVEPIKPTEKIKKYDNTDYNVFDRYSSFDLFYLGEYLKLAIKRFANESKKYQYCYDTSILYAKLKNNNKGKKIFAGILSATIILSIFIPLVIKNKDKKNAKFLFRERSEATNFDTLQLEFKNQFADIFKEFKL